MTAYLGTDIVRSFIVPATPPPDLAVAANYERFDGLQPLDNPAARDGAITYNLPDSPSPIPGMRATPLAEQTYTRGPNGALVNTLGGQPLPVLQWNYQPVGNYTPAGARQYGGPKQSRQNFNGVAETVFFADLQQNPPVPGDLAAIMSGMG